MKLKTTVYWAALFLAAPSGAWATNATGCGPGSSFIKNDNSSFPYLTASSTNYITSLPIRFGAITSGTSNCTSKGLVEVDKEKFYFVERSLNKISIELAQGQGDSVTTLAGLFGCSADYASAFGRHMRGSYSSVFPRANVSPGEFIQNVETELSRDFSLAAHCQGRG